MFLDKIIKFGFANVLPNQFYIAFDGPVMGNQNRLILIHQIRNPYPVIIDGKLISFSYINLPIIVFSTSENFKIKHIWIKHISYDQ